MTSPQPLPDLITAHDTAALAAEAAAVTAVVFPVEAAFTDLWRWLMARWAIVIGTPATVGGGAQLRSLLDDTAARIVKVDVDRADALLEHAVGARHLGVEQGAREAGIPMPNGQIEVAAETQDAVDHGVELAGDKLRRAADELDRVDSADLDTVLGRASIGRQAVPVLTRTARTTFNAELNGGIVTAAQAAGARLLWIAERDACLACTAVSGHVVPVGTAFPDGAQFGRRRGAFAPVTAPPLHPHCRCRVSPWRGHDADAAAASTSTWADAITEARKKGDQVAERAARRASAAAKQAAATTDYAAALRREAERAVLRGDSAFDSERARLGAADRLLIRVGAATTSRSPSGWQVPATVKAKTRAAVKRGSFGKTPGTG